MSPLWIVPTAVAVAGLVIFAVLVRGIGAAVRDLGSEIEQVAGLRPALLTLRTEAGASRRTLRRFRSR